MPIPSILANNSTLKYLPTEASQKKKISYDFTQIWNLMKNWTNKENRDRFMDGEQEWQKDVTESLGDALLWLPRKVVGEEWAREGLLSVHWEVREKEAMGTGSGGKPRLSGSPGAGDP